MIEAVQNDLKQYFDYIKDVYLKNFDRILDDKVKNSIQSKKSEDIEYDIYAKSAAEKMIGFISVLEDGNISEDDEDDNGDYTFKRSDVKVFIYAV